jgi:CDP-diacylglycerol--glycerol-3-phosphate 3-phosphatidyltransferase
MALNLPNQITLSRLVLAVLFFGLLSRFNAREPDAWTLDVAVILFVVAALTDWLDGYLARKHDQVTALGRILDPFVDKVLVCGAFVFFAGGGFVDAQGANLTGVAPWMAVLILGRELLVTGLRSYAESCGMPFGADHMGKIKTIVQLVTGTALMLKVAHAPQHAALHGLMIALVWLSVALTAASGLKYLWKSRQLLLASGS